MAATAKLLVEIVTETRKASKDLAGISGTFAKVGKVAGAVGLAIGAAEIGQKVVDFAKDSVKAASDTQQAMGAVDAVFKGNASVIKRWAKTTAQQMGIPAAESAQMAAVLGAQLQGMGLSLADSTRMTQTLTQRAADLAATFGGTTSQAIEAVSALLRGERDPIEKYGISLKQVDIDAQVAAMGMGKATGAAKTQAQAQAALTLLMNKSSAASGQFAREQDTLAVQQQIANAKFVDAKAALGSALLPAMTAVTAWMANKLIPAIVAAWNWCKSMSSTVKAVLAPALNYARNGISQMWAALNKLGITSKTITMVLKALAILVGGLLVASIAASALVLGTLTRIVQASVTAVSTLVGWVRDLVSWLGRIRVPSISWPKPPSWLSKLTGGALSAKTAPTGLAATRAMGVGATTTTSGGGIVINVNGALDPEGVARQIRRLLAASDRRGGRQGVLQPVGTV